MQNTTFSRGNNFKKMTRPKPFNLLNHLGVFDCYSRTTLDRIARERGKMDPASAAALVSALIGAGKIKITKYTGLINDAPLYQKCEYGPLDT